MGWTILFTILAAVLFSFAKIERDRSGAVRTPQGYGFAAVAAVAVILWLVQILGSFC